MRDVETTIEPFFHEDVGRPDRLEHLIEHLVMHKRPIVLEPPLRPDAQHPPQIHIRRQRSMNVAHRLSTVPPVVRGQVLTQKPVRRLFGSDPLKAHLLDQPIL